MASPNFNFPKFKNWKFVVGLLFPILTCPIAFLGDNEIETKRFKCGYIILVMGIFWMFEILPLSVTALLPVVLFPFLGISTTSQVVGNYMKETQMMFIGGISLAIALQYSGLHRRIALRIMILIGSSPWRLLLGILVSTTLLSCFIVVNTAVAAMMTPIVIGLIENLEDGDNNPQKAKKLRVLYMLAVGYGANIGGTATLIGSQPNLIFREIIEKENFGQDGKYFDINFLTFVAYSGPIAILNMLVTWVVLGLLYLPIRKHSKKSEDVDMDSIQDPNLESKRMASVLQRKYVELGPMKFHQWTVLILMGIACILWLTRDPQVVPGWLSLFPKGQPKIGDSSVAIGIIILMFLIPKELKYFTRDFEGEPATILSWSYVQEHFPWGIIFIVGGGLALSDGAQASGLSTWVGEALLGLETLSKPVILLVLLVTISLFTEFMSNAATISLLTPILIVLSRRLDLHPFYLTLPGAIACQYAFILPTSNPPNAVVFSAGNMRIKDMAQVGIILNFTCVAILYIMNLTWGDYVIFNYRNYAYPDSPKLD